MLNSSNNRIYLIFIDISVITVLVVLLQCYFTIQNECLHKQKLVYSKHSSVLHFPGCETTVKMRKNKRRKWNFIVKSYIITHQEL